MEEGPKMKFLARMFGGKAVDHGTGGTKMNLKPKVDPKDAEYRSRLSPEQYHVAREKGTEPAFTGAYWKTEGPGVYRCICCDAPLFSSDTKYESHTGWPSFWAPLAGAPVGTESDRAFGMVRTEVKCENCGAHLGHVFDDGPHPTGLRYCLNSGSLKLEKMA